MYAVVCQPGLGFQPGSPVTVQTLEVFTRWMVALNRRGKVILSAQWGEGAIYVLNVGSQEDAEQIMGEDPTIQSGIFRAEVHPFTARISNIGFHNDLEPQRSGSF